MVFSSPLFLTCFLPLLFLLYWLSRENLRNCLLVIFSIFFYAWGEPKAVFCMLGMIGFNFYLGRKIETEGSKPDKNSAKITLILGIVSNLGILFVYKYLNFSVENINYFFSTSITIPGISLPIGISFYCFQCLSYLVDIYRKQIVAQSSLLKFALYISFFPQLVAGPIVRYIDIVKDLSNRTIDINNWYYGLQRFGVGLAKKVLIADPMGRIADGVFSTSAGDLSTGWAWIGIFCYSLQIFFDFSGYSDMAIGLGRVFNFKLLENFNLPYSSSSIQEFWRRWHISLSSWFKDYLYIPLGGSRGSRIRTIVNVWIVFLLCGLWHGSSWTFVAWGAWQGFGLMIERFGFSKVLSRLPFVVSNLYVWLFTMLGWVLFRSESFSYAGNFYSVLFGNSSYAFYDCASLFNLVRGGDVFIATIGVLLCYPKLNLWFSSRKSSVVVGVLSLVLFFLAYTFAVTSQFSPFIYFRF